MAGVDRDWEREYVLCWRWWERVRARAGKGDSMTKVWQGQIALRASGVPCGMHGTQGEPMARTGVWCWAFVVEMAGGHDTTEGFYTRECWGYSCMYKKQCKMLIKQSGCRVRPIWAPVLALWLHSY